MDYCQRKWMFLKRTNCCLQKQLIYFMWVLLIYSVTEPCDSRSLAGRVRRAKPTNRGPSNRKESSELSNSVLVMRWVCRANPTKCGLTKRKESSEPYGSGLVVIFLVWVKRWWKRLNVKSVCGGVGGCEVYGSSLWDEWFGEINGSC